MKQLLIQLALTIFGTLILTYAVIMHEPPAFFAYVFGILTGLSWNCLAVVAPSRLRRRH
ncbi:MAG: hypothetical protein IJP68_13635 [Selenomonadaceae bacterium]|nr:hypothetical protein [Selenomonadaceae bacterium]